MEARRRSTGKVPSIFSAAAVELQIAAVAVVAVVLEASFNFLFLCLSEDEDVLDLRLEVSVVWRKGAMFSWLKLNSGRGKGSMRLIFFKYPSNIWNIYS